MSEYDNLCCWYKIFEFWTHDQSHLAAASGQSNISKIEQGHGLVFPGEQLLSFGPRGLQSTTVDHFEDLLERNNKLYKTIVKATWPARSALRGDSWMTGGLDEIPYSLLENIKEFLCDVEINDGMEPVLAKRVQIHRIMDDLTFCPDVYHNFRVCTSAPRCKRIPLGRETLFTLELPRSRIRPLTFSKLLIVGLSFRGPHRAIQLVVATSGVYKFATLPARDYRY